VHGLQLSRTQILTPSVLSSSSQTLTKRPMGRRTDLLTQLLLGPSSRLTNLELTLVIGDLIVSSHGSMLNLLLSVSLLLRRFNHELLALSLVVTHHVGLNELATAAREGAAMWSRECPGDGTRWHRTTAAAMDGGGGAGRRSSGKEVRWWLHGAVVLEDAWSDEDGAVVQGR
jgi:hypothetical protein